jgi:hypothetical protein
MIARESWYGEAASAARGNGGEPAGDSLSWHMKLGVAGVWEQAMLAKMAAPVMAVSSETHVCQAQCIACVTMIPSENHQEGGLT